MKIIDDGKLRIATYLVEEGKFESIITDYTRKVTVKEIGDSEELAIENARKALEK